MARVREKTKSSRGESYSCIKCPQPIKAGQKYYEWKPFRSFPRRKHAECGYPKQSETDTSKMATVYAAIEDAENTIGKSDDVSDIKEALESVAESAREVAGEYEEAMEAMGAAGEGGEMSERKDALEQFADDLDSAAGELDGEEFEKDEDSEETVKAQKEEWIEDLRSQATDALGELSV